MAMSEESDEGQRIAEDVDAWFRACKSSVARAISQTERDEEQLTAILQSQYTGYALQTLQVFGFHGEDEDDVLVVNGSFVLPIGPIATEESIKAIDVYVRSDGLAGYQRLPPKGIIVKPVLLSASEVIEEVTRPIENAPTPSEESAPVEVHKAPQRPSWWLVVASYFHIFVTLSMLLLAFAGLVETETRLAWYGFVFVALAFVEFCASLPNLCKATERLEGNE